jgi:hypothetical protein
MAVIIALDDYLDNHIHDYTLLGIMFGCITLYVWIKI